MPYQEYETIEEYENIDCNYVAAISKRGTNVYLIL